MKIEVIKGIETKKYIDAIAKLRMTNFRDYPYSYEGDMALEKKYLSMYQNSKDSFFIIAKDGDKVIGAITGMPLHESADDCTEVYLEKNIPTIGIYYVGEIIVLNEYRDQGLGHKMWTEFENQVRALKHYKQLAIRELEAPEKDPNKPKNYIPIDDFLKDIGFVRHPEIVSYSKWKEVGADKETKHALVNWLKTLKAA
jgi:ribosomal protein S18 acetylase RimI-like enzyme